MAPPALLLANCSACMIVSGPAHVVDGDTVDVGSTRIRLKGVDAPELREPGGAAATEAPRRIVGSSDLVCAVTGERTNEREVGYCFTDAATPVDIGQAVIAQGFALACPRFDARYLPFEQSTSQARKSYCVKR